MTPQELLRLFQEIPGPQPIFYRLYHDANGDPLFYSMESVPGCYIEIDQEAFKKNSMSVKVINGRLVEVNWKTVEKIVPSDSGVACDTRDVTVVVDFEPNIKWRKKQYAIN